MNRRTNPVCTLIGQRPYTKTFMNEIYQLIQNYGDWIYLIAFFWAALEGETFVIFAGLAAQRGYLNIYELIFSVGLGSLVGDQICFWLGRCYGARILHHFPKLEPTAYAMSVVSPSA